MEEGSELRPWDELIPDALGLIFSNLPFQETLTVIPSVCRSWRKAVMGPYCWQEIDIVEWSQRSSPETIDRMLRMLITWSAGSLRKLSVSGLPSDASFSFVADHAKSLQTFRLPRCEISDLIVQELAWKLSTITSLDLSYCRKIGAPSIEAIGKNCKFLTGLRRIMHPLEIIDKLTQDDEALAIAATMPKLKHLEMAYLLISTEAVLKILANCRDLELLDVRGCWNVKLDEGIINKFAGLKVVGPLVIDCCYEGNGWDDCSAYSGSSGYLAWDFVAGEMDYYDDELFAAWEDESMDDLELRFYDGLDADNAGFDWPQSP